MNMSELKAYLQEYFEKERPKKKMWLGFTWRQWLTAPEFWYGATTWEQRLWNATRWRCYAIGGDVMWIPPRFRFAYRSWRYDRDTYAVAPIHLLLRAGDWWNRHRNGLERWGLRNGLYQMPAENIILSEGRWRWPGDMPAGGRRRVCSEWSRAKQLDWHERGIVWADDVPEERLCS